MRRLRWILYALAALLAAGAAFDLYARVPARIAVAPLGLDPATRSAVLLFHGRGGRDEPSIIALERHFIEQSTARPGVAVRRYAWSPHSDTRFRSAVNGAAVGAALGAELATLAQLESVHLIGQSAGAYVLDPLCVALKSAAGHPVQVAMTFLDPIGFQGVFDAGWGARHYGACADYAEAWINTDDPVPATNAPLAQAFNVDVTAADGRASYDGGGHRWPARYYLDELGRGELGRGPRDHAARPRGAVERR